MHKWYLGDGSHGAWKSVPLRGKQALQGYFGGLERMLRNKKADDCRCYWLLHGHEFCNILMLLINDTTATKWKLFAMFLWFECHTLQHLKFCCCPNSHYLYGHSKFGALISKSLCPKNVFAFPIVHHILEKLLFFQEYVNDWQGYS
jgi:hypothetical protein